MVCYSIVPGAHAATESKVLDDSHHLPNRSELSPLGTQNTKIPKRFRYWFRASVF